MRERCRRTSPKNLDETKPRLSVGVRTAGSKASSHAGPCGPNPCGLVWILPRPAPARGHFVIVAVLVLRCAKQAWAGVKLRSACPACPVPLFEWSGLFNWRSQQVLFGRPAKMQCQRQPKGGGDQCAKTAALFPRHSGGPECWARCASPWPLACASKGSGWGEWGLGRAVCAKSCVAFKSHGSIGASLRQAVKFLQVVYRVSPIRPAANQVTLVM